jgi:hypothetical protein
MSHAGNGSAAAAAAALGKRGWHREKLMPE